MMRSIQLVLAMSAMVLSAGCPMVAGPAPAAGPVIVNGVELAPALLERLATHHQLQIPAGTYWYDSVSGAFGVQGGPIAVFLRPGLALGGALRPGASGGGTGVFLNRRELHPVDLAGLQQLLGQVVSPGRYWLDGEGNAGVEGQPAQVNLLVLARQRSQQRGEAGYLHRGIGGTMGSDGECYYFNDPKTGSTVMGGNC